MFFCRLKDKRNVIKREYVLPDFMERMRGYVRIPGTAQEQGQVISVNHERFMLPEALFR